MFNLPTMFFRTNFCLLILLGLSSCYNFEEKSKKPVESMAEVEEGLYQISLNAEIPEASEEFKKIKYLAVKARYKKIPTFELDNHLGTLGNEKKNLLNFDPPGASPRLLTGILNAINSSIPSDPFNKRNAEREVIRILLSHGADPNLKDETFEQSALHTAIMTNDYEICKLMIEYGADPFSKDIGGRTALELAYQDEFTDPNQKRIYELIKKAADKKGN